MNNSNILLEVNNLKKYFPIRKGILDRVIGQLKAVDGIDLFIREGESLGLVGESGCGKTTAGRTILGLTPLTSGEVIFRSQKLAQPNEPYKVVNMAKASPSVIKSLRQDMQIIFQDPYSSLNPRMTVGEIVGEGLRVHGIVKGSEWQEKVVNLLDVVGLSPEHMKRYPHQFSGGQRQRIGIARALALEPKLIVADEPVSALDVSIQAQVLNLLHDLQEQFKLTYLFISHDLSVIKHISDRVAVMYLGKIMEHTTTEMLFNNPKHPYTEALISAVQVPEPDYKSNQILLEGDVPNLLNSPSGCYFHPRCRYAKAECKKEAPKYREIGEGHFVACHLANQLELRPIMVK
jgi:oligopeptide/dipeptide ABC transporter ATP-binding protein